MPNTQSSFSLSRLSPAAKEKALAFLGRASEFHLGGLPTEQSHPKTENLSQLAKIDPERGLAVFNEVERDAYAKLRQHLDAVRTLSNEMRETLDAGGNVYFCGCGATGRLSLAIETLWRAQLPKDSPLLDRVKSFMAGGDYALVRSIENFEDHPEYGARQLTDAGFMPGDLLVATSEGGETPFVIGAAEHAAKLNSQDILPLRKPWFIYCNPDEILVRTAERSRNIIENSSIKKINLTVGPMAVTGSTRLQATSVLMFAAGSALFFAAGLATDPETELNALDELLRSANLEALVPLIIDEANVYERGEKCLHFSREHAISVFTDLTERSPTFSIPAFENLKFPTDLTRPAWTYLEVPKTNSPEEAWEAILLRKPRAIEWDGFSEKFGQTILSGFDFSEGVHERRSRYVKTLQHPYFIGCSDDSTRLEFRFQENIASFSRGKSILTEHLFLKLLINATSTLVMGRVGRFEGNVMLWVKSSNNKLIDRSIRYIQLLLSKTQFAVPAYNEIAIELFDVVETLAPDEPAVIRTRDRLLARLVSDSNVDPTKGIPND